MATAIPNSAMLTTAREDSKDAVTARDVKELNFEMVTVPDAAARQRPDRATVDRLKEDIAKYGLLQPIGVRETPNPNPGKPHDRRVELVYGLHRFVAMKELYEADPAKAPGLAGVVYDARVTDEQALLMEVRENLMRKELTPEERVAHEAIYLGHAKKAGAVAKSGRAAGPGRAANSLRKNNVYNVDVVSSERQPLPTPLDAMTKATGHSPAQVHVNLAKVSELAGEKVTLDSPAEALISAGTAALKVAPTAAAERKARVSANISAGSAGGAGRACRQARRGPAAQHPRPG